MLIIFKIDLHLSKPRKNAEPNMFPQDLSFQISETAEKVCLPKKNLTEMLSIGVVFCDQFPSAIHENNSEINQFTYLKSFLCDSAELAISGLHFHQNIFKRLLIFSNSVICSTSSSSKF